MKYALITTSVIIFGLVTFIFVNQRMHYRETLSLEKEKLQLKSQIDSLRLMITQQQGGTEKEKDSKTPLYSDDEKGFKEWCGHKRYSGCEFDTKYGFIDDEMNEYTYNKKEGTYEPKEEEK